MNVYQKLNEARERFHQSKLNKSGQNKFAGYKYFELSDFVVPALQIFKEVGLTSVISFGKETADMRIVNNEKPDEVIVIESPMSSAALKGCHEVQNLGAVQTYLRRYLWVAALEIVEHDALDATTGKKGDGPVVRPTKVEVDESRESLLQDVAIAIQDRFDADDIIGAWEEFAGVTDADEKTHVWGHLPSNVRSALKKHSESLKGK
jgi:ERF superfamily